MRWLTPVARPADAPELLVFYRLATLLWAYLFTNSRNPVIWVSQKYLTISIPLDHQQRCTTFPQLSAGRSYDTLMTGLPLLPQISVFDHMSMGDMTRILRSLRDSPN